MSECPQRPASDSRVSASGARESHFLAILSRMKYIERWALMRSSRPENLSEHALDVALIAHVLASLGNVRHGRHLDADRAAVLGLFHDASEIITGDMPTPIKYFNPEIREAYRKVEEVADQKLLAMLPPELRPIYEDILRPADAEVEELVKAADKLSAHIKCLEELKAGNEEFRQAARQTAEALESYDMPELRYFREHFLGSFQLTLDEME